MPCAKRVLPPLGCWKVVKGWRAVVHEPSVFQALSGLGWGVGVLADTFDLISQNSFIFPSSSPHPLTLLRIPPKHFKSKIINSD